MKKIFTLCACIGFWTGVLAQTSLPTSWNFSNPGITTPPTGWTMALGTNGNLTYAFGIGDALSAKLDATGEYFMIQFSDKPGPLSYYLSPQNAGAAWGGQFDIQESADGSSWSILRSITYKATTATNYTGGRYQEVPASTSRFIRFYYTTKLPGGVSGVPGGNMGVDSVWIQAAPAPAYPTLNVKRGASTLVNGSTTIIGNSTSTAFTIENKGTAQTLHVDSVQFTGVAAADYSVNGLPLTVIANGNNTLNLSFAAAINGSRKATMKIYSNDTLRSPFILDLYGIGGTLATVPASQPVNLLFSSLKPYGYTAIFSYTGQKPEHFIVLRKKGSAITEIPVDGSTYMRGDYIGSAQVEKITDSIEGLSPNYIMANTGYYYALFSFNGPAGFENYLTANPLTGNITTPGKGFGTYYSGINPANPNFVSSLSAKINPHDTTYYSNHIPRMVTPWLARDTSNGRKVVTCVYTGDQYVYVEPFQWANGTNGATLTREHTWCQSWMPSNAGNPDWPNAPGTNKELPEYSDLFNLFPAHQANANLKRSNNPFDEVVTPTYTSPTGLGILGKDSANRTTYEPRPEQKGDVARALFYMAVCYHGVNGANWSIPANQNLALLRQWHKMDPPDNFEIARHEFAAVQQGNRNPFIDHPEWADRINFSNMTYIPVDTTSPKNPLITIVSPNTASVWLENSNVTIKWTTQDVDSVNIYFSADSLKTLQTLATGKLAIIDSFSFLFTNSFTNNAGLIIVKDAKSNAADTSDYFKLQHTVGLVEANMFDNLLVYPNPTKEGLVTVKLNPSNQNNRLSLYTVYGSQLLTTHFSSETVLDLGLLSPGIYFIKLSNFQGEKTVKIIKE